MAYELHISFGREDLEAVYDMGLAVAIVWSVSSTPMSPTTVVWQMFPPFQSNQVNWDESYHIYSTDTQPIPGAQIGMTTTMLADPGWSYTFENGQFTGKGDGIDPRGFQFVNRQGKQLGFGIAKMATVDGVARMVPLDLFEIPDGQTWSVAPVRTVSVFLATYLNSGIVIRAVPANALVLDLDSQSSPAQIGYDRASNSLCLMG